MTSKCQTSRWWRVLAVKMAIVALIAPATSSADAWRPRYMSRPDLNPPVLNIKPYLPKSVSTGYWFFATQGNTAQPGPYIFDQSGELVWSGYSAGSPPTTWDFRPTTVNDTTAFTYWQGNVQPNGQGNGQNIILSSSYEPLDAVRAGNNMPAVDGHEFNVIENGTTALVTISRTVQWDLSAWNVTAQLGWVVDSVFQEVDIGTGKVVFEWRSLDHVPLNESMVEGPGIAGTRETAWDYFHMNSVDKISTGPYAGHYLISARHTSTLYLISPSDGSILWRLSGRSNSDIPITGFNFTYQHDARFHNTTANTGSNSSATIISLFDNASNGAETRDYSSGLLISVPNTAKPGAQATLLAPFKHPRHVSAPSQGNVQLPLPNDNVLVSWGSAGSITEHLPDGTCVLEANFADPGTSTYRAYKMPPPPPTVPAGSSPDVYMYSRFPSNESATVFYASWNGATAVKTWVFYGSNATDTSHPAMHWPFESLGNASFSGFETNFTAKGHFTWGYASAYDADGRPLGSSQVVRTFTPSAALAQKCNAAGCPIQALTSVPRPRPGVCWTCPDGRALYFMFVCSGFVAAFILFLVPTRAWWRRKQIYERRHGKHYRGRRRQRRGGKGWNGWIGGIKADGRTMRKEWEGQLRGMLG